MLTTIMKRLVASREPRICLMALITKNESVPLTDLQWQGTERSNGRQRILRAEARDKEHVATVRQYVTVAYH